MEEIHQRTKRALERIIERADHEGVECLVLCTHAATNIALGRALTGDPEVRPFPFVSLFLAWAYGRWMYGPGRRPWESILEFGKEIGVQEEEIWDHGNVYEMGIVAS